MDKILDKKSQKELNKHRNNIYLNNIINRIDKAEPTYIFNPANIVIQDIFLVNLEKCCTFTGHNYNNDNVSWNCWQAHAKNQTGECHQNKRKE